MQLDLIAHDTCRHAAYAMSCEQFEGLLLEAGHRCQVCGLIDYANQRGKLFLDHNRRRGDWAVRGLLCSDCNTLLGMDNEVPRDERFRAYLDNAWYLRAIAAAGVSLDMAEPATPVLAYGPAGGRWALSRRDARGWRIHEGLRWVGPHKNSKPKTWRELLYKYGPYNLTPISE